MQARWRESAAQGLAGAWVARLGFVEFGLAVLWLAAGAAPGCGRGAVSMHAAFGVCMVARAAGDRDHSLFGPVA